MNFIDNIKKRISMKDDMIITIKGEEHSGMSSAGFMFGTGIIPDGKGGYGCEIYSTEEARDKRLKEVAKKSEIERLKQ